ncbi:MAG: hypothetical protein JST55_03345 [Bacteroidetes bacterium]|nr:hypothetical protein [Bacteroidota bacterium]
MRKILVLILLLVSGITYSQSDKYDGYLEELFLARQPSARAEAMGRGHVADNQNDFGSFYNPALSGLSEGLNINTSFSGRYYNSRQSFFNYFGATYKLNKIGSIGLSRYHFDFNEEYSVSTIYKPYIYTLNFSREMVKDFYAGVNINLVEDNNPRFPVREFNNKGLVPTFDFGVLKNFEIHAVQNKFESHKFKLGLSVNNFTNSKYVYSDLDFTYNVYLPVIFRIGGSYDFIQKGDRLKKNGEEFSFLGYFEFEKILNIAKYYTYKAGCEFCIYDILFFRMGYVSRNAGFTNSILSYYLSKFTQFTYGAGVKIPLDLIFKMKTPLLIKVDYVNLRQPGRDNGGLNTEVPYPNFNTIGINLNWVPVF